MSNMVEWILMERCQIDGAIHEAGYIFTRPDDWNPGGVTVRGEGPVGSPEEFKLLPIAVRYPQDLPKQPPSDGPPPGHNMPAEIEYVKHDDSALDPAAGATALPVTDERMVAYDAPPHEEPLLPPVLPDPAAPPPPEPAKAT